MDIPATRTLAALCAALALAGCATFSNDGGFDPVAKESRALLNKEVRWPRTEAEKAKGDAQVAELLQQSILAEDAVQIALLNNRSLQAAFEELGISEADLVQSGRLPNPAFTLRHAGSAAQYDIEETLSFNMLSLFAEPFAHEIEKRRFAQAQSAVVIAVVQLANETRQAYFASVAARESVHYLEQVKSAAEAGAELARRMVAAGNWNLLDQAREQSFYTDAEQRFARGRLEEDSTREKLLRLMGLPGAQPALRLAETLPELPQSIEGLPDVEQAAMQSRMDLRLQRMRIDELAHRLGLTRATRFVNVLEAGPTRVLQGARSMPYEHGYEVRLEVPIFDGGGPRMRRAEALYSQAVDRFAQAAVDARSQIRQAYSAYEAAFDIAKRQRDEVVPARKLVASQNLLRYNASLVSIFDLLADARAQIASVDDYIQSVRDFWMAKSELDTALLGNPAL
ncbi:MAG TPA: TolC family protein [Steroidobacteraceae bacterium]|jgi:outer membrane protein TolC|nr:TolC family protein [Steroidobacteraceae bacterium]